MKKRMSSVHVHEKNLSAIFHKLNKTKAGRSTSEPSTVLSHMLSSESKHV